MIFYLSTRLPLLTTTLVPTSLGVGQHRNVSDFVVVKWSCANRLVCCPLSLTPPKNERKMKSEKRKTKNRDWQGHCRSFIHSFARRILIPASVLHRSPVIGANPEDEVPRPYEVMI